MDTVVREAKRQSQTHASHMLAFPPARTGSCPATWLHAEAAFDLKRRLRVVPTTAPHTLTQPTVACGYEVGSRVAWHVGQHRSHPQHHLALREPVPALANDGQRTACGHPRQLADLPAGRLGDHLPAGLFLEAQLVQQSRKTLRLVDLVCSISRSLRLPPLSGTAVVGAGSRLSAAEPGDGASPSGSQPIASCSSTSRASSSNCASTRRSSSICPRRSSCSPSACASSPGPISRGSSPSCSPSAGILSSRSNSNSGSNALPSRHQACA